MITHRTISTFALAAALGWTAPAYAQDAQSEALRAELSAMREQMAAMAQQIDTLESRLETTEIEADQANTAASAAVQTVQTAPTQPASVPKSAPVTELSKSDNWSFTPFGRLMVDAGGVNAPDGINDPGLGFGTEVRRARIGVKGDLTGGFNYKLEVAFEGNEVEITDAILGYEKGDLEIAIGQHNNFQSLEELTSSRFLSFLERAAFTDAFGFGRRVGVSGTYSTGDVTVQTGLFTSNIGDLNDENNSWSSDSRVVFGPKLGDTQLHIGGSLHYREFNGGQSSVRYRQRPQIHSTDTRLLNTGSFDATGELGYGLEFIAINGPFHATGETFWQKVDRPGALADPTFFGGYAEVGYFLTGGDTRTYKGAKFDRIKPENPVGEGGFGAVQINARYDYLDLNDAGIIGGQQTSYGLSLVWTPTDYTRFMANYIRIQYRDAAVAAGFDTDYGVDTLGVRAQFDF